MRIWIKTKDQLVFSDDYEKSRGYEIEEKAKKNASEADVAKMHHRMLDGIDKNLAPELSHVERAKQMAKAGSQTWQGNKISMGSIK
eukprot:7897431-Alexandrium_andersonii.AAC.1